MFEKCTVNGKLCAFCTHSDYNQKTGDHDGEVREYCGMIVGGDTTTKKLRFFGKINGLKIKFSKQAEINPKKNITYWRCFPILLGKFTWDISEIIPLGM